MGLKNRLLGHPFVYEHIRPLVVGGIDVSRIYRELGVQAGDVVLDVGCGTGDALRHLPADLSGYVGFDTDPEAIAFARERATKMGRDTARFEARLLDEADVLAVQPTHVILVGLLHHVDNTDAVSLLRMLGRSPRLKRLSSLDIVYLPGQPVSNALAFLDRGRFCRRPDAYKALYAEAGLPIADEYTMRSHPENGRAMYYVLSSTGAAPAR